MGVKVAELGDGERIAMDTAKNKDSLLDSLSKLSLTNTDQQIGVKKMDRNNTKNALLFDLKHIVERGVGANINGTVTSAIPNRSSMQELPQFSSQVNQGCDAEDSDDGCRQRVINSIASGEINGNVKVTPAKLSSPNELGDGERVAMDNAKNKDSLLDSLSKLSLNNSDQQIGVKKMDSNNTKNALLFDLKHIVERDVGANINGTVTSAIPNRSSMQELSQLSSQVNQGCKDGDTYDGCRQRVINSIASVEVNGNVKVTPAKLSATNKRPMQSGLSTEVSRKCPFPVLEPPLAATPRITVSGKDDSDNQHDKNDSGSYASSETGVDAKAAIPKASSSSNSMEHESVEARFSRLSIKMEPWKNCLQPPRVLLKPKESLVPSRVQESDEEDDQGYQGVSSDDDDDDEPIDMALRGVQKEHRLSKGRDHPYNSVPSPFSGSDQSRSPFCNSDQSRSPLYNSDQSRSPLYNSDQSRSPLYNSDQSRSPLYNSDQSSSPIPNSYLSWSPIPSYDKSASPIPGTVLSIPQIVSSSDPFKSPVSGSDQFRYRLNNFQSTLPDSSPRTQGGATTPCLNVPCKRSLMHSGGSYTVNENMAQGEISPALSASSSPPSNMNVLKIQQILAGGGIVQVESTRKPVPEQQPVCISAPAAELSLTPGEVANIFNKSPNMDSSQIWEFRTPEDSNQSFESSGSPEVKYLYSQSQSIAGSPEEGTEADATDLAGLHIMTPPTAAADGSPPPQELVSQHVTENPNDSLDLKTLIDWVRQSGDIDYEQAQEAVHEVCNILHTHYGNIDDMSQSGDMHRMVPTSPLTHSVKQNATLQPVHSAFKLTRTQVPPMPLPVVKTGQPGPVSTKVLSQKDSVQKPPKATIQPAKRAVRGVPSREAPAIPKYRFILPAPSPDAVKSETMTYAPSTHWSVLVSSNALLSSNPATIPQSSGRIIGSCITNTDPPKPCPKYGVEYLGLFFDKDGDTNLHIAVANNIPELALYILENRGNKKEYIDARNNKGQTPLYAAVFLNNLQLTEYLLKYGADPNLACNDGNTPLHLLAMKGSDDLAVSNVLCKNAHISLNKSNKNGLTPLHIAVQHHSESQNMIPFIRLLLGCGAELSFLEPNTNRTALHMAVERGISELVTIICKCCHRIADAININSKNGTALHCAAMLNKEIETVQYEIVKTLLQYGGSPSSRKNCNGTSFPKNLVHQDRKRVKDLFRTIKK